MAQPMLHHRTPEYEALFVEVRAGLKRLFQTVQDVIPFTSSGTGAMEAAVVNTLSPGDTVLVLRAGKFSERWEEICRGYGISWRCFRPAGRSPSNSATRPGRMTRSTKRSRAAGRSSA